MIFMVFATTLDPLFGAGNAISKSLEGPKLKNFRGPHCLQQKY